MSRQDAKRAKEGRNGVRPELVQIALRGERSGTQGVRLTDPPGADQRAPPGGRGAWKHRAKPDPQAPGKERQFVSVLFITFYSPFLGVLASDRF